MSRFNVLFLPAGGFRRWRPARHVAPRTIPRSPAGRMHEIDATNTADYLIAAGRAQGGRPRVEELAGGVSNVVLRVTPADGTPEFVLKQVREKLRTTADWRSRPERIWHEVAALELLGTILPAGAVPRILFVDRPNFLFAMSAASREHVVWKTRLLAGEVDVALAARLGELLALVHRATASGPGRMPLPPELLDGSLFDELRLDPYYRWLARRDAELADPLNRLIRATESRVDALTLGDFSPKNILLDAGQVLLVDFETAHLGDPAFDLGFFLAHLVLKSLHVVAARERLLAAIDAFLQGYGASAGWPPANLEHRVLPHLAGCLLARVDGKSPVDYLTPDEQAWVRSFARPRLIAPPAQLAEFRADLEGALPTG
jgi:aminoglycoside phosphotransferase (APT) family kinase protein